MRTTTYRLLLIIAILSICGLQGCQEKDDKFFTETSNLEGTIYEKLQEKGNFTNYLKCLERTPYVAGLSKSGSWTVFIPDDEAFQAYLSANSYNSVDDIPDEVVSDIVRYSIVQDAYNTTTLTFYKNQWYEGSACRRTTLASDTVVEVDSKDYPNFQDWVDRKYPIAPRNNRAVPVTYFLDSYFEAQGINQEDYAFLFPGESFQPGDMKVLDAHVNEKNVVAENGIIFVLDKVLEPLPNIYQNLLSEEYTGNYSMFKNMVDRYGSFQFFETIENPATGALDSIYRLSFQTGILNNYPSYDINAEEYPRIKNNVDRTFANAVGMFAPTNQALNNYLNGNSLLGRYYSSYDDMPLDVLGVVLNMFYLEDFWDVCPSQYDALFNLGFEKLDIDPSNVVDQKFCSNGMFVGINKVFTSNSFSTVLGPLLLDSEYSIMLKSVKSLQIDQGLKGTGANISVIGLKNSQIVDMPDPNSPYRRVTVEGYNEDLSLIYLSVTGDPTEANNRVYPDPTSDSPSSSDINYVTTTLNSIMLNQIVDTRVDPSSDNFYQTKSGEIIKVSNGNQIAGGENIATNTSASIESTIETLNGPFHIMDGPLGVPTRYTYGALSDNPDEFSMFLQVLDGANVKVAIPKLFLRLLIGFLDLRRSYTLLAPNNEAVQKAVTDSVIPNPAPSYLNDLSPIDKANAIVDLQNFAKKHFIQNAITTDGMSEGDYSSLFVDKVIDFIPIYREFEIVNNYSPASLDVLNIVDGSTIASTGDKINILSKMVVIHEIDNYLK